MRKITDLEPWELRSMIIGATFVGASSALCAVGTVAGVLVFLLT